MIRPLLSASTLALLAGAASAQVAPDFSEFIDQTTAGRAVDVIYQDFDGDKVLEAVVVDREPSEENGLRSWKMLVSLPEPMVALEWSGAEVRIEIEEPKGPVVWSDGITWAFDGESAYPHYDLVREEFSKLRPPTETEIGFLAAAGYPDVVPSYTETLKLDLGPYPGFEILMGLNDDMYRADDSFDTPYFIFSQSGELLLEGRSNFLPSIFAHPEGGVQVIEDHGDWLELIRHPMAAPQQD